MLGVGEAGDGAQRGNAHRTSTPPRLLELAARLNGRFGLVISAPIRASVHDWICMMAESAARRRHTRMPVSARVRFFAATAAHDSDGRATCETRPTRRP